MLIDFDAYKLFYINEKNFCNYFSNLIFINYSCKNLLDFDENYLLFYDAQD